MVETKGDEVHFQMVPTVIDVYKYKWDLGSRKSWELRTS